MEEFTILYDTGVVVGQIKGQMYEFEEVSEEDIDELSTIMPLAIDLFKSRNITYTYKKWNHIIIKNISSLVQTLQSRELSKINVVELCDCYVILPPKCNICEKCFARRYSEGINIKYCPSQSVVSKMIEVNYNVKKTIDIPFDCIETLDSQQIIVMNKDEKSKFKIERCICYPDCANFSFPLPVWGEVATLGQISTSHRNKIIKNLKEYVGRFCPVINIENLSCYDGYMYPVYGSISCSSLVEKEFNYHGGKGNEHEQAQNSAIGEALERYSARKFGYDEIYVSSQKNLSNNDIAYLSINDLYPFGLNEDLNQKEFEWCKGSLMKELSEEFMYIPANVVYFPYEAHPDKHFTMQSTTGLASGVSVVDAKLQGILELIERHYYTLAFRSNDSESLLKDIKFETDNPLLKRLQKHFKFHLTLLNDSKLSCFVVHCVLENKKDTFPKYTHGSGAAMDIRTAIYRSIFESLQLRTSQVILYKYGQIHDEKNIAYLKWGEGKEDEYYGVFLNSDGREVVQVIDNYLRKGENINPEEILPTLIFELEKLDVKIYCVNLSRKDSPLKCVRVIAPKLQDIDNEFMKITPKLKEIGIQNSRILFS